MDYVVDVDVCTQLRMIFVYSRRAGSAAPPLGGACLAWPCGHRPASQAGLGLHARGMPLGPAIVRAALLSSESRSMLRLMMLLMMMCVRSYG